MFLTVALFCLCLEAVKITPLSNLIVNGSKTQHMKLDFIVQKLDIITSEGSLKKISKRLERSPVSASISSLRSVAYLINLYVGSNKQKAVVLLDTGSSDLWIPHSEYDPVLSFSSQNTGEVFEITYLDGTAVRGLYYKDQLQLSPNTPVISEFKFARAKTNAIGVLGIADKFQEASSEPYDNLPWALKAAGVISKASYSIFLGQSHEYGSVIFGGIDTEKFSGNLTEYKRDTRLPGLGIFLELITANGRELSTQAPVLLDSGTSLGFLGGAVINELDGIFNTTTFISGGVEYRQVSCDQPDDKFLAFNFGKNTINLSFKDAVVEQVDGSCLLGFAYYQNMHILGDVFLRKAYVYYDLSEQTISLAQVHYSHVSHIISG